jgi:hypothetical protein
MAADRQPARPTDRQDAGDRYFQALHYLGGACFLAGAEDEALAALDAVFNRTASGMRPAGPGGPASARVGLSGNPSSAARAQRTAALPHLPSRTWALLGISRCRACGNRWPCDQFVEAVTGAVAEDRARRTATDNARNPMTETGHQPDGPSPIPTWRPAAPPSAVEWPVNRTAHWTDPGRWS